MAVVAGLVRVFPSDELKRGCILFAGSFTEFSAAVPDEEETE
jgi:hypothetical protein